MTKCKECGEQISTKADACPKCGAKRKRKSPVGCLIAIILLVIVVCGIINSSNSTPSPPPLSGSSGVPTSSYSPPPEPATDPYAYHVMEEQNLSHGATKRMIYRLYFKTQSTPDQNRMKATAEQLWRNGNQGWDQFTVFMIFGPIKNFDAGAYGIAEFNPSGLSDFQINTDPLQILGIKARSQPQPRSTRISTVNASFNPQELRNGQAFFVSKETPLMPEFEPSDPLEALQRMTQIPEGGAFKIYEVKKKGTSPWYRVYALDQNNNRIGSGWINSAALLGQDLKLYK